ncbi:lysophospholipid acyltransferase 1 isoform X2 [Pteropus alecto]|uniref:Lysophospholipid acyltransferase 1 isoform X2 n=1 Tax=Pteropus vampyrus TaxID=132908 RepID=A0A6P6CKJ8_PTEVA|nr:lysophospholipid acyltransferase 1 isoform X2 [Pteropus vampyrus]XP_024900671.1 lysophospholipid acyltransferase 1 isoform X2 [Pteropus alecto]XP_039722397.1 lysophospholipid acyltransferase 1 isoform X2 [Pteropus giganteus]
MLQLQTRQVNFVACQLVALFAAFWFRIYLSPGKTSPEARHAFATIFGIYFVIFCFGWYSVHLFVLVLMCYGIMVTASISNIHRYSFFVAMGYLTICHISRIYIFHYGILTTDFSGPLMIVTQKITTLAFQIHDGLGQRAEDLSAEQHRLAVKVKPSFLEYLSYLLNFMSVIAGPCNNFKDYIAFIEGRHTHMKLLEVNWKQKDFHSLPEPSPTGAVIRKLCMTLVSLLLFLTLTKTFPVTCLVDDWFVHKANFPTRLCYLYVVMQASKPKYYFAWTLADAVNNAAGFGFSGVDKNGNFCWDLLSNLNIWKIETATSFKMYLENWNIQTATWLKRVCYERVPWYPTVLTFILSALWHGVYPGYYFTFLTGTLVTLAARTVRNNYRHYFLSSKALKFVYDLVTWAVTQLAVSYTVAPFVMLAVEPTISLYKSMYFYLHIVSLLIILFLPVRPQAHIQRWPQTLNSVKKKTD